MRLCLKIRSIRRGFIVTDMVNDDEEVFKETLEDAIKHIKSIADEAAEYCDLKEI